MPFVCVGLGEVVTINCGRDYVHKLTENGRDHVHFLHKADQIWSVFSWFWIKSRNIFHGFMDQIWSVFAVERTRSGHFFCTDYIRMDIKG